MANYLIDCEIDEMKLGIPRDHAPQLVDYFDGAQAIPRGAAKAVVEGRELRFEARGGRLVFVLRGEVFVPEVLDVFDDLAGEFFGQVIVNLFQAYRGTLRCKVRWAQPRTAGAISDVVVEDGRSNWPEAPSPAGWLVEAAEPLNEEEQNHIRAKLEEGRQLYAEYLRLKNERETPKRSG